MMMLSATACSEPYAHESDANGSKPGAHEKVRESLQSMTERQNFEREKGRSCAAKSKISPYNSGFFSPSQQLLAFEFPDGVRGGKGKITGKRLLDSLDDSQCGSLEFEQCADVQLYSEDGWDHMSFVVVPSSGDDQRVVSCALQHLAGHFNIGLSGNDATEFGRMNEKPFAHLHIRQATN